MPEPFAEDEFVVILDHYLSIKEGGAPDRDGLSKKLHALNAVPHPSDPAQHRTGEGLRNVLGRFAAVDPDPPAVLASYAARLSEEPLADYRRVWDEYAGDPAAVRSRAAHLLEAPTGSAPGGGASPFELGRIYNRQEEIHGVYGGQRYGGISTPKAHPMVLIFSGEEGAAFGYADEELAEGGVLYYGEGQSGDMEMTGGNRAIRDHVADGRSLHLFKKVRDRFAQYGGEYECEGYELKPNTPDRDGNLRTAIAFKLRPKEEIGDTGAPPEIVDAAGAVAGIARGQGFSRRLSAADRHAIELRAMSLTTRHFEELGFEVEDVSMNQPYDLRCINGKDRVDVEVKGTTTSGRMVLLTPYEVQHALAAHPQTALAVARGIALHDAGTSSPTASGGELDVRRPWQPLDMDLKPVG